MKKAYITPNTEVELMTEEVTILAGSVEGFDEQVSETPVSGGDALGRDEEDDLWD